MDLWEYWTKLNAFLFHSGVSYFLVSLFFVLATVYFISKHNGYQERQIELLEEIAREIK